jgi:hypothetical protein
MSLYLWIEEQQQGPFDLDQVSEMLKSGKITDLTLWCRNGDRDWTPLKEHNLLMGRVSNSVASLRFEREEESCAAPSSATPQSESSRIRHDAVTVATVSYLCFFFSVLGVIWALIGWGEHPHSVEEVHASAGGWDGLLFAAASFAFGLCLNFMAQLLHIRALLAPK